MAIPWDKIRAEWLKGGITQKELAEKYGVKLKTIQNRASNEGWKNSKGKIREKTEELLQARISRARANRLEKLIIAQENTLDGLVALSEKVKQNPLLFFDEKGGLRNAESLTKAIQTGTMTQRDLYSMKNIDQKFVQKKWREEQKLQVQLKQMGLKDEQEQNGQMVVYIHAPAEEDAAEQGGGTNE